MVKPPTGQCQRATPRRCLDQFAHSFLPQSFALTPAGRRSAGIPCHTSRDLQSKVDALAWPQWIVCSDTKPAGGSPAGSGYLAPSKRVLEPVGALAVGFQVCFGLSRGEHTTGFGDGSVNAPSVSPCCRWRRPPCSPSGHAVVRALVNPMPPKTYGLAVIYPGL